MFGVFANSLLNKDLYIYERLVCTWDKKKKKKQKNPKKQTKKKPESHSWTNARGRHMQFQESKHNLIVQSGSFLQMYT